MAKKSKRTKKFLQKKTNLTHKVKERKKRQNTKRKRDDQKFEKEQRKNLKRAVEEEEVSNEMDESKMSKMGLDEFLCGGFMNSDGENDDLVDVKKSKKDDEQEDDDDKEDDVKSHRAELEALRKQDPEFYEYLKQTDAELLDFGADDNEEEEEGDDKVEEHQREEEEEEDEVQDNDAVCTLTPKLMIAMKKATFETKSIRALAKFVQAFRCACHVGAIDSDPEETAKSRPYRFQIKSSAVFNDMMLSALQNMHSLLCHHLDYNTKSKELPQSKPRWDRMRPIVSSFCGNLLHFVSQLMDREMQLFALQSMKSYMMFYASLPKLHRKTVKVLLTIWAGISSANDEDDEERVQQESEVRISSFLRLRELVSACPTDSRLTDLALKNIYLTHIRNAKFVNDVTASTIAMRRNCVVELFLLRPESSYQQIFVYIRQLAVQLRLALTKLNEKSVKSVYNWQFVESMRTWAHLLCSSSVTAKRNDNVLKPLVYPLIQIIRGVSTLQPTAQFVPIRLQCAALLNDIAVAADVYIPTAPVLLAVLTASPFRGDKIRQKGKDGGKMLKPPDMNVTLRLQKSGLETHVVKDQVVNRTLQLLTDLLEIHKFSIAFPEFLFPISVQLRQFLKTCKNSLWRQATKHLLKSAEKWAEDVRKRRCDVNFGPSDVDAVAAFMRNEKTESRRVRILNPLLGRELRKGHVTSSSNSSRKRTKRSENDEKKQEKKTKKQKKSNKKEQKIQSHKELEKANVDEPDEMGDLDDWTDEDDSEDEEE